MLTGERLHAHLARSLAPLYVVTGDEVLLVMEAVDAIRAAARAAGFGERTVLEVEAGFDWGRLGEWARSASLFSSRRLVELRMSAPPNGAGQAALEAYARRLPEHTLTVVTLPRLAKKAMQAAWFAALAEAGEVVEILPVGRAELPAWLAARLARHGFEAEPAVLEFLAERVEGNLLAAHQEVEKLALLFPPGRLSLEQVSEAVSNVARFDAFALADAVLAGDRARAARIVDALAATGESPVPILGTLAWLVRSLARARAALDAGADARAATRAGGFFGARAVAASRRLPRLGLRRLEDLLGQAAEVDRINKGLASGDAWAGILRLALAAAKD